MKATKWFSKAMTLGFVFFMALLLVNPENSLEFVAMIGGTVMSYGAFLAQGIGEGNVMSGLLLGSISSYAFVAATLLTAIPVAILLKEYSEGGE